MKKEFLTKLCNKIDSVSFEERCEILADIADLFRFLYTPVKTSGKIDYEYYKRVTGEEKFGGLSTNEELIIIKKLTEVAQTSKKMSSMFYCIGISNGKYALLALDELLNSEKVIFDEEDLYQIVIAFENVIMKVNEIEGKILIDRVEPMFQKLKTLSEKSSIRIREHFTHISKMIKGKSKV